MNTMNATAPLTVDRPEDEVLAHAYMPIDRLYADASGDSHLDTWLWSAVEAEIAPPGPPAPPVFVTTPEAAEQTLLLRLPAGWDCQPHPAPHRHLMVVVLGTLECTTSDGETRQFVPGGTVLVEDTTGRGHSIRPVDGEAVVAVTQLGAQTT